METCDYSSINAMVMNEQTYIIIRESNLNREPEWASAQYYDLKYRKDAQGVIVASSDWNQDGWVEIPNHTMLVVDRKDFSTEAISLS